MSQAVKKAHQYMVCGIWTATNCESYLKVNGLNMKAIKSVIDHAANEIIYKTAMEKRKDDNSTYNLILDVMKNNPKSFQCWELPSLWTKSTMLHQHIDALMHLLMLGVQKTTMIKVKHWHIMRGSQTSFYNYSDGILDSIQSLNLSWCKTVPYKKGKMGGWISESYLAMARLNKWFYSGVNSISYDKAVKELDILPRSS